MTFYCIWCQKGAQISLCILPFHQSEEESRRADCGGVCQTAEGKAKISHCTYLQVSDVSLIVWQCVMQSAVDWTTQLQSALFVSSHSILWLNYTCIKEGEFLGEQGLWEWHHLLFRFHFLCLQNKSCNEAITKFEEAAKLIRADIIKTAMGKEWGENKGWGIRWECQRANVAEMKDFLLQSKYWDAVQLLFVFFLCDLY